MTKFKDVAHLYLGCEVAIDYEPIKYPNNGMLIDCVTSVSGDGIGTSNGEFVSFDKAKPLLRPLDSMTKEEVLTICKLACESVYGDYRFSKWSVERSPHELCHWDVNNKRSLYSFTVSSIDGDVLLYDGEDIDPVYIDSNYRFWYLKQGFDLFSLIPNGEAIDKTKTTQNG